MQPLVYLRKEVEDLIAMGSAILFPNVNGDPITRLILTYATGSIIDFCFQRKNGKTLLICSSPIPKITIVWKIWIDNIQEAHIRIWPYFTHTITMKNNEVRIIFEINECELTVRQFLSMSFPSKDNLYKPKYVHGIFIKYLNQNKLMYPNEKWLVRKEDERSKKGFCAPLVLCRFPIDQYADILHQLKASIHHATKIKDSCCS